MGCSQASGGCGRGQLLVPAGCTADHDVGLGSGFLQQGSILGSEQQVVPSNTNVQAVGLKPGSQFHKEHPLTI